MSVRVHEAMDPQRPLAALPVGLKPERIAEAVEIVLRLYGESDFCLDVILVDDPTLADLHEQFLGDPTPTDVMAFDLRNENAGAGGPEERGGEQDAEEESEGEVYVSVERARTVLQEREECSTATTAVPTSTIGDPATEILLYAVHGALHLCGFDDHEPEERRAMRRAEIEVFRTLGCALDEAAHLDA